MLNRNFLIALISSGAIGLSLPTCAQPGYSHGYVSAQPGYSHGYAVAQPGYSRRYAVAQPGYSRRYAVAQPGYSRRYAVAQPGYSRRYAVAQPGYSRRYAVAHPDYSREYVVVRPGYSGVYIGGQVGWGQANHKDHSLIDNLAETHHHKLNQEGIAGRGYFGLQLNPYLGVETGVTAFSNNHASFVHENHTRPAPTHFHDHWKVRTTQWDLLARIGTPFAECGLRGDLKLGAAGVFANNHSNSHEHHNVQYGPAAGASIGYNFDRHIAMDVSYLHVFSDFRGHHKHFNTPNTDLVTLGISYLFF